MSAIGLAIISDGWLQLKRPRVTEVTLSLVYSRADVSVNGPGPTLMPAPPPGTFNMNQSSYSPKLLGLQAGSRIELLAQQS